jgi:hypothetical protein
MSEMSLEFYDGKTLSDLCKDIITNAQNKRNELDVMVSELRNKIANVNDAVVLAPVIKAMMDTSVRNDEILVKLAAVGQRIVSSRASATGDGVKPGEITQEEMKVLQSSLSSLSKEALSPIKIQVRPSKKTPFVVNEDDD